MTRRPLFIALFIALLLHGGVALWLMTFTKPPETKTEPTLKPPTVTITLAAMQPTITEPVIKKIVQPEVKPVIKTVEKTPVKPEPVLKPAPKPITKPLPKTIPKPVEQPKTTPKETPKRKPQKNLPPPLPNLSEVKEEPEPTPPVQPTTPPVVSLSDADAKQYQQQLSAWLNQYKTYPKRAKRMRIEGEGILKIEINRTGQAQSITLKQSTGNRLLDKAALKTAQQASPFPAMPKNDPRQSMIFEVPIAFLLR